MSFCIVLLKHLIESKVLDELVGRFRKAENKFSKEKLNQHIIKIIKLIYHQNKQEKQRLDKFIF